MLLSANPLSNTLYLYKTQRNEENTMNNYGIRIEICDGELKRILDELTRAQEQIYACYNQLQAMGVLTIKKETTSGN